VPFRSISVREAGHDHPRLEGVGEMALRRLTKSPPGL
jgi:hypothetical protein